MWTRAIVSLLSEVSYQKILSHLPLKEVKMQLTTYSAEKIPLLEVPVQYESQKVSLPQVIGKGHKSALMGHNWLEKIQLDWQGKVIPVSHSSTAAQ